MFFTYIIIKTCTCLYLTAVLEVLMVRWAAGKRLTNHLRKLALQHRPPLERRDIQVQTGYIYVRVDASLVRVYNFWGPRDKIYQVLDMRKISLLQKAFSWWT